MVQAFQGLIPWMVAKSRIRTSETMVATCLLVSTLKSSFQGVLSSIQSRGPTVGDIEVGAPEMVDSLPIETGQLINGFVSFV